MTTLTLDRKDEEEILKEVLQNSENEIRVERKHYCNERSIRSNHLPIFSLEKDGDSDFIYTKPIPRAGAKQLINFKSLQKYECYVTEIFESTFKFKMIDETTNSKDLLGELDIEDIDDEDLKMLSIGSVFYLNFGYQDTPSGRTKGTLIRFRRLPKWSKSELSRSKLEARNLANELGWKL